jgi:hypothetical protein
MKIKIKTEVEKEVELPHYFRSNKYPNTVGMTVGNKSMVLVESNGLSSDIETMEGLGLYPEIRILAISWNTSYFSAGVTQISEVEFKNQFLKVSLDIEKLLN